MRDVSIVVNARMKSSRLPNKMIRKFGDTCLIKLAIERLCEVNVPNKYLAANEEEILKIWEPFKSEVKLLERSPESVLPANCPNFAVAFAHYGKVPDDYVMTANACFPFAKAKTYEDAIEYFKQSDCKTMTSVIKSGNIFFDKNKKPINLTDIYNASTQWNDPVYFMAHMFHIFDKKHFMNTGNFWDYTDKNPEFFEVPQSQCFDIDTQEEFEVCEKLYLAGFRA